MKYTRFARCVGVIIILRHRNIYFDPGLLRRHFYFQCSNPERMFLGWTDSRADLYVQHHTSLRTMLLSCWSRRMLSNVPHRPPLMFWQLAQRAWQPLGTKDRAAPKPKLANLTWHNSGRANFGTCLRRERCICKKRCCRCTIIHKLTARGLQNLDAANVIGRPCIVILKENLAGADKHLNCWWQRQRLPCRGSLLDWLLWKLIFRDREKIWCD